MLRSKSASPMALAIICLFLVCGPKVSAQTTTFNYQGRLQDGGTNANGNYDFQFTLWDALTAGTQQPQPAPLTVTRSSVAVAGGVFTVQIDFGVTALPGADRFLEISVRPAGGATFTTLSPRQPITSTPYSIRTLSATTADGLSSACVSCVQDSQINAVAGSKVNSAIPVANVPAGSVNYIQNSTSPQAASNFNISGNGTTGGTLTGNQVTGNVVNATVQYNLNGNRAFSVSGVGDHANSNTFVGNLAGTDTTPDSGGAGSENSFYGRSAGRKNTTGFHNSFFGESAGSSNTTGFFNSFFGANAGASNTTGLINSFFGQSAGISNSAGGGNSFFGTNAGIGNTVGGGNSFFGLDAGITNTTGTNNTILGHRADVGSDVLTNATAIGAQARVDAMNALVLGSINGVNGATADTNVGIGVTMPQATLHVVGPAGAANVDATPALQVIGGKGSQGQKGAGVLIQAGNGGDDGGLGGSIALVPGLGGNGPTTKKWGVVDVMGNAVVRGFGTIASNLRDADLQVGYGMKPVGTAGSVTRLALQPYGRTDGPWKFVTRDDASKAYLDWAYGSATTGITQDSDGNVGIATNAPIFRLHVIDPGNAGLRVQTNTTGGSVASFGGNGDFRIDAPGVAGGRLFVQEDGKVGIGTFTPNDRLEVNGVLRVDSLGTIGGTQLCRNLSNQIANCSSSLRYKTNIAAFSLGLSFLKQLRPITFDWKQGGMRDVGFGAEDVAKVDPLFVTYNDKGQVEGVKYDRLSAAFVNAFREQQKEIESQQKLIESQQQQIDALKKLVCATNPGAEICKRKN